MDWIGQGRKEGNMRRQQGMEMVFRSRSAVSSSTFWSLRNVQMVDGWMAREREERRAAFEFNEI